MASRYCRYHLMPRGCAKGANCPYPHIDDPVCKYYLQGTCDKGQNCPFPHAAAPPMPLLRVEDTTLPLRSTEDEDFERQFKNMTVRYAADLRVLELILSTDPIEGLVQPNHTGPIEGQVQPNSEPAADMCTVLFSWRNNDRVHQVRQVRVLLDMLSDAGLVLQSRRVRLGGQNRQRIKVFARFASPDIAATASSYQGCDLRHTLLGSILAAEYVVTTRVFVAETVYNKFSSSISGLALPGVTVSPSHRPGRRQLAVMITGPKLEDVMKVRADVSLIVAGQVVMNQDGQALWDDFITTESLSELCEDQKIFIHCDEVTRKITTYCVDHNHTALHQQIFNIGLFTMVEFLQPLSDDLLQALNPARRSFLESVFDTVVTLDETVQPPTLSYACTMAQARSIQAWLLRLQGYGLADLVEQCPICLDNEAGGDTVNLECGHMYHANCFDELANNAFQDAKTIQCSGFLLSGLVCEHVVTISELSKALPPTVLEQRLEQATSVYLRSHSTNYAYCSMPDCGHVFSVSTEPTLFQCPGCENTMCTACKGSWHLGQTCAEFQREQTADLSDEDKKRLGLCECPRCATGYQQNEGCNHMTCLACQTDFCFHCGQGFDTAEECVAHCWDEHGGLFGPDLGRPAPRPEQVAAAAGFAAERAWMGVMQFGHFVRVAEAERMEMENAGVQIVPMPRINRRTDGRLTRGERRRARLQPVRVAAAQGVAARRMGQLIQAQQMIQPEDRNPDVW